MAIGLLLFLVALGLRLVLASPHLRGRLAASALVFLTYTSLRFALTERLVAGGLIEPVTDFAPLLVLFGVLNGAVPLVVHLRRRQGLADRYPTIVQDAVVIALFGIGAVFVLHERVFAMTAVGAAVIGFALQDTLGNLFAGLAIQIEKPFRVGHWVRIAGTDGLVTEITWRATKVRTKPGNLIVVPNSVLSRDTITNFSEPTLETRVELDIGASYDAPPNQVKQIILDAIENDPAISKDKAREVLVADFAASAVIYRVRVWTTDFEGDERLRDRIRTAVFYAFRRKGIVIPYPTQIEIHREETPAAGPDRTAIAAVLEQVSIFDALDPDVVAGLAARTTRQLFAANEVIVKQGDHGSSMFVLEQGAAVVLRDPGAREVAQVVPGGFFGEMSLLTGEPRTATVLATADSWLLELTADVFRTLVLANPVALVRVSEAVAARRAELAVHAASDLANVPEPVQSFVDRVRRFLRLAPV